MGGLVCNDFIGTRCRTAPAPAQRACQSEVVHLIAEIRHQGKLLHECPHPGETRADGFYPGHANAAQLSRNRFLIIYSTRGWRGTDDNTSIIYQLRSDAYDGPVITEGILTKSIDDWDPLGNGERCVKAHVHPVVFGVPSGAMIKGKPAPSANLFVAKWERLGRRIDPATGFMLNVKETNPWLHAGSSAVEWMQFRLNEAADDIEIVRPVDILRQRGFNEGYAFCDAPVRYMRQTMTPAVPFNDDGSEWIDYGYFDHNEIAALKYCYNVDRGVYEWTQTGPVIPGDFTEPSVARYSDSWIVAVRLWSSMRIAGGGPVTWFRIDDPFTDVPAPILPLQPRTTSPITMFQCADGALRLITNDPNISPYGHQRDPLYIWDVDPDRQFTAGEPQVLFYKRGAGIAIREEAGIAVDQGKFLPHTGGCTQTVVHRVRPVATNDPKKLGAAVAEADKEPAGMYYATVRYAESYPGMWAFE
jgi:hypothetical protein